MRFVRWMRWSLRSIPLILADLRTARKSHSGGRRFDPVQLHKIVRFFLFESEFETIRDPIVSNSGGESVTLQDGEHPPLLSA